MISITDIKVNKAYRDGKYYEPVYETKLAIRLPETHSDQWIALSEEATAKVIELIVSLASEGLRFEHYVPRKPKEQAVEEVPATPCEVPADEMEPL